MQSNRLKFFIFIAILIGPLLACGGMSAASSPPPGPIRSSCDFTDDSSAVYPAKSCIANGWSVRVWDSESHHHVALFANTREDLQKAHDLALLSCQESFSLGGVDDTNTPGVAAVSEDIGGGYRAIYAFLTESCYLKN